jgi:hypothetical protein
MAEERFGSPRRCRFTRSFPRCRSCRRLGERRRRHWTHSPRPGPVRSLASTGTSEPAKRIPSRRALVCWRPSTGRYRTRGGEEAAAVVAHGTLQTIDLVTGEGLDAGASARPKPSAPGRRRPQLGPGCALLTPLREASEYPIGARSTPGRSRMAGPGGLPLTFYRRLDGLVIIDYKASGFASHLRTLRASVRRDATTGVRCARRPRLKRRAERRCHC